MQHFCDICLFWRSKGLMLDIEKPINAVERAIKSVRSESIRNNLIPVDFSSLKECVEESDLVFESVVEKMDVKNAMMLNIGGRTTTNYVFVLGAKDER